VPADAAVLYLRHNGPFPVTAVPCVLRGDISP
jgi:hypothetical protein